MPDDLLVRADAEAEPGRHLAPIDTTASNMLQVIARAAADPRCDVQKMEALLRMQRELISDQARAEFDEAMARLQPKLPRIPKRGIVDRGAGKGAFPFGRWEDIDELVRPLLDEEGFSLSFNSESVAGGIIITGTLRHRGGHSISASLGPIPPDQSGGKNPAQALGSSSAYGKRYTTTMLLNLTFEGAGDDSQVVAEDEFISAQEVSHIGRLLTETDSNVEKFLHHFRVDTTADIRRSQYPRAINMLLSKKANQNEGA